MCLPMGACLTCLFQHDLSSTWYIRHELVVRIQHDLLLAMLPFTSFNARCYLRQGLHLNPLQYVSRSGSDTSKICELNTKS